MGPDDSKRRQVLLGAVRDANTNAYGFANSNAHSDGDANSHGYGYGYADGDAYTDCNANSDCYGDVHADGYSNSDGNANTDGNADSDSHVHADGYSHSYSYGNSDLNADSNRCEANTDGKTASDNAATASVVRSDKWNSSGGNSRVTLAPCHSRSVATASPSAACLPWPTCSGPVGFAETNSTMMRSPARSLLRP